MWTTSNEGVNLTPPDVLKLIKANYGVLKLTLLDNLDVKSLYGDGIGSRFTDDMALALLSLALYLFTVVLLLKVSLNEGVGSLFSCEVGVA